MSKRTAVLVTLAAATTSACSEAALDPETVVRRDSAGIEIVESRAARWGPGDGWTLAAEPAVTIGAVEGNPEYLLDIVTGATRLADGRIVISDRGSNSVRFYDSTGEFLTSVGRSGEGPGEYVWIRALWRCGGDSIFVFDLSWAMDVYDTDGVLHRDATPLVSNGQRPPYNLTCSRSGQFAAVGWGDFPEGLPEGLYPAMSSLTLMNSDGETISEVGEVLSSERLGTSGGSRPHPFGKATVFAFSEESLFVGDGGALEIRVLNMNGDLERVFRGPAADRTITSEIVAAYERSQLDGLDSDRRPAMERSLADMPYPERYPAFDAMMVDPDGDLWVRPFHVPGSDPPPWWVFDPQGELLGSVAIPEGIEVLEIGGDYLLGLAADALGVQRVELYPLIKP